jgi:hypothetical protein
MGWTFRHRTRLTSWSWLNWSRSGVSGSARAGPVTANTRGDYRIRGPFGLGWRGRWWRR